jgi:hypothetical protein
MGNISTYGRSVIMPKRVKFAFKRNATADELVTGYEHKLLSEDDALVLHLKLVIDEKVSV